MLNKSRCTKQNNKVECRPHKQNERPPFRLDNKQSEQTTKNIDREPCAKTQEVNNNHLK